MKSQFVRELPLGARVDSVFVLASKEMRRTRTGEPYLSLEFTDRTGRIPGIWFRPGIQAAGAPVGATVAVKGVVTDYRKVKRISVESLEVTTAFDRADMLPHGTHDPEETLAEFRRVAGTISTPALRAVLRSVFGDKSFLDRFVTSPASEGAHHVYLGGLLEHTVSVAGLCETFAARFAHVDRDLLVAAALLHDIGVVDELSWELTIASTDAGRLLGHQVLGDRRLHAACGRFDRRGTAEVLLRLSHALLAHHAATSDARHSIVPATVEAMLLAHADAMDISASEFAVLSAGSAAVGERWTDDRNRLGRRLLVSSDASLEPVRVPA